MSKFGRDIYMTEGMKGVESTPEEQECLATTHTNNNGSLISKKPSEKRNVFRSTRLFMVVFLAAWIMQGMFLTYFVSIITTLERLFKIKSTVSGVLLSATEIGQICTALFLTYFAGRGHRPRWIGFMMLVLALGVIGCIMPHIVYGDRLLESHLDVYNSTVEPMCTVGGHGILGANVTNTKCEPNDAQQSHKYVTDIVIPWLFVCLLVVGIGQTGVCTLGIPYIDDNVGSNQSPLYMAITIGIRVLGPALGFFLGALCTKVYVNPLANPGVLPGDPQWVSAWWLGMVLISGLTVTLSMLMFCFPRQIKLQPAPPVVVTANKTKLVDEGEESSSFFTNFYRTIKRQLTNDILMCRMASSVLHLVPMNGLYSFLPKYLETQYKLQPYDANLVSGVCGILVMGLGIISSGIVILKMVPTARQVAAWTAITALIYSAGMVALMFLYCPGEQLASVHYASMPSSTQEVVYLFEPSPTNTTAYGPVCLSDCDCTNDKFGSVCGQDGLTYFSACHAGCRNSSSIDGKLYYYNCECIDKRSLPNPTYFNTSHFPPSSYGLARQGDCASSCPQFYFFLALFAFLMFTHASGEVGSILLTIRCTDPKDKAMAMGVIQFAIGLFGNVPCPIVFGAVVEAACAIGKTVCETLHICNHYDTALFRHYFLGLTAGIMFLGFLMDLIVWSKAGRIDISPDRKRDTPLSTLTSQQ